MVNIVGMAILVQLYVDSLLIAVDVTVEDKTVVEVEVGNKIAKLVADVVISVEGMQEVEVAEAEVALNLMILKIDVHFSYHDSSQASYHDSSQVSYHDSSQASYPHPLTFGCYVFSPAIINRNIK